MNFGGQPAGSAKTLSKLCELSEPISSSEEHRNPYFIGWSLSQATAPSWSWITSFEADDV